MLPNEFHLSALLQLLPVALLSSPVCKEGSEHLLPPGADRATIMIGKAPYDFQDKRDVEKSAGTDPSSSLEQAPGDSKECWGEHVGM